MLYYENHKKDISKITCDIILFEFSHIAALSEIGIGFFLA